MNTPKMPEARYILPSFVEHSAYGVKESNPYNKLFEERIIFLGAALPNARVLIHQPATGGVQGQVSDLEIQAAEIERMRTLMDETLARHTGRTAEQVRKDTDRDKILTAAEAVEYGIIDQVFDYRKLSANA